MKKYFSGEIRMTDKLSILDINELETVEIEADELS